MAAKESLIAKSPLVHVACPLLAVPPAQPRVPAVVALLTFAVALFGFVSYMSLPREASPDVKIPMVLVSTPYIGVSPADVESLVTIPIEKGR